MEKKSNFDQIKEITGQIEQGIQELFESEKYKQYLTTMSRFHSYSFNNTMLIHLQRPGATMVAGYNKWEQSFGRHVKKGAKGIKIFAPTPYMKKIQTQKIDPDTHLPVLDAEGKPVTEEKSIKMPRFKVVSVFDVSQTYGKPIPQLSSQLTGNVENFEIFMEALRRTSPVPMEVMPIAENMDGYFNIDEQRIAIREGMGEVQTVCAAIHEIGHAKLHNYSRQAVLNGEVENAKDRLTEEVEAESISYAVCQYFGIDTGENSFGYIAEWSSGKELKELKASLETINKTASDLIAGIEGHIQEIAKERGIENKLDAAPAEQDRFQEYAAEATDYFVQRSPIGTVCGIPATNPQEIQAWIHDQLQSHNTAAISQALQNLQYHVPNDAAYHRLHENLIAFNEGSDVLKNAYQDVLPPSKFYDNTFPDPLMSAEFMEKYGYTADDLLPLSQDRARELFPYDISLYMLYSTGTEDIVLDELDISRHDAPFGISQDDWDSIKDIVPHRDIEKRFLESTTDSFAIYQLRQDVPFEYHEAHFDWLGNPPERSYYEPVYTRFLNPGDDIETNLNNLSSYFIDDPPEDYTGHPLRTSDIIALKRDGVVTYHYCDYGKENCFKELPNFQKPENYLRATEMSTEDDYGMIDGIINNGKQPTVAELEQQARSGTPISLMDLAAAIHREKKQSVLEQLKPATKKPPSKGKSKKTSQREI